MFMLSEFHVIRTIRNTVNLSITNHLGTAEKVHYIRVFTTSGFIYNRVNIGVHSKVYVCYIREFIVSRVHYREGQLY